MEDVVLGDWAGCWPPAEWARIPEEAKGTPLTLAQAEPHMRGWDVPQGAGSPDAHGLWVWTTHRFIWATQYDGIVKFSCAPRDPRSLEREGRRRARRRAPPPPIGRWKADIPGG